MYIDDDSCDAHSHMNNYSNINSSSNRNSISNRVVLTLSQKKAYDKYILKTTATIRSMVIDCKTAYIIIVNKTITPGRKSTSHSSPPFASREDAEQAKNAFRYCVENNKSADSINYMHVLQGHMDDVPESWSAATFISNCDDFFRVLLNLLNLRYG